MSDYELENAIKRGDEYFDLYEQELRVSKHFEAIYNELADRLRDRDEIIEKLHELLKKNNIKTEVE